LDCWEQPARRGEEDVNKVGISEVVGAQRAGKLRNYTVERVVKRRTKQRREGVSGGSTAVIVTDVQTVCRQDTCGV